MQRNSLFTFATLFLAIIIIVHIPGILLPTAWAQNQTAAVPDTATLHDGAAIKLRMTKTFSSADARPGDKLSLEVLEDVLIENRLVIAKGGTASATVTTAEPRKGRGRDGKLVIHFDYVTLNDGETVSLRTSNDASGAVQATTLALMAAPNSVSTHESPMMQYMHGKDVAFLQGTEITAYINGDTPLSLARFHVPGPDIATTQELTRLVMNSWPNAAEVDIDGRFISDTPAAIDLAPGPHTISVRMAGYQNWQRTLQASGGTVNLTARLIDDGVNGSVISNCWGGGNCSDSVGSAARDYKERREEQAGQNSNLQK